MRTNPRPSASKALRHSPLVAALGLALAPMGAGAATFLVKNSLDFGADSLRDALTQANLACGSAPHTIEFDSSVVTPFVIAPSSSLPAMTCQMTINASQRTDITIDGSFAYGGCGLNSTSATPAVVHKLKVNNFTYGNTGICGNVHVLDGTFSNNETSISLTASGLARGNTVQAQSGNGAGIVAYGSALVDGNIVTGGNYGIRVFGTAVASTNNVTGSNTGIYVGDSAKANANVVVNTVYEGVYGYGGLEIVGNTVSGTGSLPTTWTGILAYDTPLVKDNTVTGVEQGISVNGPGLLLQANFARDNLYQGIRADNGARVEGNFASGNQVGIEVNGADVVGNYVGSVAGGAPNNIGIYDQTFSGGHRIENNVASGNGATGIYLDGFGGTISGNLVGTNAEGTGALANAVGIQVSSWAYGYDILGNTVSGNQGAALFVESDAFQLRINGNFMGTSSAGTGTIPNGAGIDMPCGGSNFEVDGNVISGNAGPGIAFAAIDGTTGAGVSVTSNRIGVAAGSLSALANDGNGVTLDLMNEAMCFGEVASKRAPKSARASRLQEGKLAAKALAAATAKALRPKAIMFDSTAVNRVDFVGNIITANRDNGIQAFGGQGNSFLGNRIWANGAKNIDLGNPGAPLANDPKDQDGGPNNKQNSPVITAVSQDIAGRTVVSFTLETGETDPLACASPTPPATGGLSYQVEFYENVALGAPAGQVPIGSAFINGLPCGGEVASSHTFGNLRDNISALARQEGSLDTSEFSAMRAAVAAPAASISGAALPLAFGPVPLGGSATQTFTITSVGGQPYRIVSFGASALSCSVAALKAAITQCSAPFSCDTTCVEGQNLASGASCTVSATFTPTTQGTFGQSFYICDNSAANPREVAMSGTGTPPPVVTLAPASWNFGSVRVGQSSTLKSFSIVNDNTTSISIGSITVNPADFVKQSTTCGASLAPGAGCEVLVGFSPSGSGAASGTLTVTAGGGAGLSNATSALSGNGVQVAEITLPASVDFGAYTVGAAPVVRTVTFTNTGNADVVFSSIGATTPFTLTNGCGTTLAPGASCTLTLTFAPATPGNYGGTLSVASNAVGGSGNVPLTGSAQDAPVASATLTPGSLNLGAVPVGSTSAPGTITVASTGTAPYVVSKYTTDASCATATSVCSTGEFLCSLGCDPGVAYAPGASCTLSARFSPQALGVRTTSFYICDNTTASPRLVTLSGEGTNPTVVDVAPSAQDFGTVPVGQSSASRAFTLVNSSGVAVTVTPPFTSGNFRVASHNCPTTLGPAQRCTVEVVFAPTFAGAASGQLILQAAAGSARSSAVASLTGIGGTQPVLDLPSAVDFGSIQAGSGSATRTITVANTGNSPLGLSSITITGANFALVSECGATVAAGSSCALRVTFTATQAGEYTGAVTVVGDVPGGPRTVQLSGRAQPQPLPLVRVSPGNMGFGDRQIGSQSASQRVTVSNVGGAAAAIESMSLGPDYVVTSNTCGGAIAAQQSCVIELALRPVGFGPRAGQLAIVTNSEGSPHTVNLSGTGCRPYTPGNRNSGRGAACAP